jgi:hypothetical protein
MKKLPSLTPDAIQLPGGKKIVPVLKHQTHSSSFSWPQFNHFFSLFHLLLLPPSNLFPRTHNGHPQASNEDEGREGEISDGEES